MTRANSGKESRYPAGEVTVRRVNPTKKAAAKRAVPAAEAAPLLFSESVPQPRPTRAKPVAVDPGPTVSGWTQEQARDLLWQGYSHEQVARRTGYPLPWVLKQAVPNCSLQDKIAGRG